jgi:Zn finger protein HypA/HybF involved in hydrogenase expression
MIKVFDVECQDCGHTFEAWVKEVFPECPECKGVVFPLPSGTRTTFKFHDRKAIKNA